MTLLARLACVALVALTGRWLTYALAPRHDVLAGRLEGATAGPTAPAAAAVIAVSVAVAAAVLWLVSLAVRERHALSGERGPAPSLRQLPIARETTVLFAGATAAFVALESSVHARAGLGWHGLHCLEGPVHRNALPVLAAVAVLVAAAAAASRHLLAWMRRTIALLRARPPARLRPARRRVPGAPALPSLHLLRTLTARGPPARVVPVQPAH